MLSGLVGFCDLVFCGGMGFVLVLRCLVIVVLFVIVLFARSVSRRANVWLVVWKGGVYNKLWLLGFVDTPVGVSFVFL